MHCQVNKLFVISFVILSQLSIHELVVTITIFAIGLCKPHLVELDVTSSLPAYICDSLVPRPSHTKTTRSRITGTLPALVSHDET